MMDLETNETYRARGTVAGFFLSSAIWFVVFALGGFILASWMVAPDLFLYKNISWLVFSRVRPVHTNGMIFGFVGSAPDGRHVLLRAAPRARPAVQPVHRAALVWLWNLVVVAGSVTLLLGLQPGQGVRRIHLAHRHPRASHLGDHVLQSFQDRAGEAGKDPLRLRLVRLRGHRLHLVDLLLRKRCLAPLHRARSPA